MLRRRIHQRFEPPRESAIRYSVTSDIHYSSPFGWATIGRLVNNATARVVYILPIAGYVILYSDYVQRFFELTRLPRFGFLTFLQRINFLYYGSLTLLFAFVLYRAFSPRLLRSRRDLQHFIGDIVTARDNSTVHFALQKSAKYLESIGFNTANPNARNIQTIVGHAGARPADELFSPADYTGLVPEVLRFYYNWQNFRLPYLRFIIFCIASIGYLLLFFPALDLFLRVLGNTFYHPM